MRALIAPTLLGMSLLSGCLSTEDVSLGELPADVGLDASAEPSGDAASADAEHEPPPTPSDAAESDAGLDTDAAEDDLPEAGLDAESDAWTDAAQPVDAARDGASADASVPLICIREPWHCR